MSNAIFVENGKKSHHTCQCCGREFFQQYFNCPYCDYISNYGGFKSSPIACHQYRDSYWAESLGFFTAYLSPDNILEMLYYKD